MGLMFFFFNETCFLVCVCVWRGGGGGGGACACAWRVRVRVCVFILFHCNSFFRRQRYLGHTWGYGSTILCCEYFSRCFCQVPSSSILKKSYFTSLKTKLQDADKLERKGHDILTTCEKMIYIDIGYKSASNQNGQVTKKY